MRIERNNIIIIIVAGICFFLLLTGLGACNGKAAGDDEALEGVQSEGDTVYMEIEAEDGSVYIANELIGSFDSKKEAQAAADLYGIRLESFSYGVAVFICEGDPVALIEEGQRNGWPPLSLNHVVNAF